MINTTTNVQLLSGKRLNQLWHVGARHALYHREGRWFNNLRRFPGALFDPNGYVLFETEQAYKTSQYVRVTQETNVRDGISAMPNYRKVEQMA